MTYRVQIPGPVTRYVRRLPPDLQQRLIGRLERIAADPYEAGVTKPLHGSLEPLRSCYAGNLRILFEVDDLVRVVVIHDVGPRGDIYKR